MTRLLIENGVAFLLDKHGTKKNRISSSEFHEIIIKEYENYSEKEEEDTNTTDCEVAELCIDVGTGHASVLKNNEIEFCDCTPIHVDNLEFVLNEARAYIEYRDSRVKQHVSDGK